MFNKFKDYNGLILFFGSKRKYSDNKSGNNSKNNKLDNKLMNKVIEDSNGKRKILFFLLFICGILLLYYVFFILGIYNLLFTHFKNFFSDNFEIEKLKELELQKKNLEKIELEKIELEKIEKQELEKKKHSRKILVYTISGIIIICITTVTTVYFISPDLLKQIGTASGSILSGVAAALGNFLKKSQENPGMLEDLSTKLPNFKTEVQGSDFQGPENQTPETKVLLKEPLLKEPLLKEVPLKEVPLKNNIPLKYTNISKTLHQTGFVFNQTTSTLDLMLANAYKNLENAIVDVYLSPNPSCFDLSTLGQQKMMEIRQNKSNISKLEQLTLLNQTADFIQKELKRKS